MNPSNFLTALAAAAIALCAVPAGAKTYVDSFSFSTQDQSLWSPGAQASWSYDSGFLGGTWGGGYDDSSPVRFGLNAIAGKERERVPGTGGEILNPAWVLWDAAGRPNNPFGPNPPRMIDNPIPAAYVDTRTGGSASVLSSGQAGLRVRAGANGGGVDVTLPFTTRLSLPDKIVAGQAFTVLASGSLGSGARMSIDAPSINASINGIVGTTNTLSGKACGLGLGCAEDSTTAKIPMTEFNILSLDTSRANPATALGGLVTLPAKLGQDIPIEASADQVGDDPIKQTVGHVTVYAPRDASGGTVNGNTLRLETNQTLLRATADLGGIAQLLVPVPLDVLQPSLGIGVGQVELASIGGTLLNAQVGAVLGLSQRFSFEMQVRTLVSFDTDVFDTNGRNLGKEVAFDLGRGKSLVFNELPSQIRYSFGLLNRFGNDTGLSLDPLGTLKAGCFNLSVAGGALADIEECALDEEFRTTNLVRIPVYQRSFALRGFDVASFSIAGAELAALTGLVPTPVPEPSTYAMLLLGLGVLGATARRRAREQQDTMNTPQR